MLTNTQRQAAFRLRSLAHGLCACGQYPPAPNRATCQRCLDRSKVRLKEWRDSNGYDTEARRAHYLVGLAVGRGELVQAGCEVCGDPQSQAHHDDYAKPLEVRWLCRQHHRQQHHSERKKQAATATQPAPVTEDDETRRLAKALDRSLSA